MSLTVRKLFASIMLFVCILVIPKMVVSQSLTAQPASATSEAPSSKPASSETHSDEIDLLKKQLKLQQDQIGQLRSMLLEQQQLMKRLATQNLKQGTAPSSPAPPAKAASAAQAPATTMASKVVTQPLVATTGPPPVVTNPASEPSNPNFDSGAQQNPALTNSPVTPIPLQIGSATLTPVGFVDATAFFRTRNLGSGIGASFGSLPFSNTVEGRLSETRLTIQNSRIGMMLDSHFGENKVRGYLETDFLGAQPTNAFVTSNSDSLRMRLYWVDIQRGKFEFLGGQSWSLLTPGRVGISPMPSDIFYTQDMDTNYQVGLTWSRQLQFRFTYHATPNVTAAVSLENAEQYTGTAVTFPPGFNTAQVGTGNSTSTPNLVPDVVGKLAFDGHASGKLMHVELAGLLSTFKIYNPASNNTYTTPGGGGSVNFDLELIKNFHLIATSFYSDGGGRYIYGLGPNFIVRPDYSISLVHAYSGIAGFEYQVSPKTLLYGYYGGAYFGRNFSVIPASTPGGAPTYVGYGYPGSSNAANKSIQEGTFGIIQTLWKNSHYGALQLITQYSYLTRAPWYVALATPKNANLSEAYVDLRYVLP